MLVHRVTLSKLWMEVISFVDSSLARCHTVLCYSLLTSIASEYGVTVARARFGHLEQLGKNLGSFYLDYK